MTSRYTSRLLFVALLLFLLGAFTGLAFGSDWQKKVPEADRSKANPVASDATAVAAGASIYAAKCAKCHGTSGEGKGSHPPLRSEKMRTAAPGELEWFITHGNRLHGMPGFGSLPEEQRWQLVSYIKSLNAEVQGDGSAH